MSDVIRYSVSISETRPAPDEKYGDKTSRRVVFEADVPVDKYDVLVKSVHTALVGLIYVQEDRFKP